MTISNITNSDYKKYITTESNDKNFTFFSSWSHTNQSMYTPNNFHDNEAGEKSIFKHGYHYNQNQTEVENLLIAAANQCKKDHMAFCNVLIEEKQIIISMYTGEKDQQKIVKINAKIHLLDNLKKLTLENHTIVVKTASGNKTKIKEYKSLYLLLKYLGNDFADTELSAYKQIKHIAVTRYPHDQYQYPIRHFPFEPFLHSDVSPLSYSDIKEIDDKKLSEHFENQKKSYNDFFSSKVHFANDDNEVTEILKKFDRAVNFLFRKSSQKGFRVLCCKMEKFPNKIISLRISEPDNNKKFTYSDKSKTLTADLLIDICHLILKDMRVDNCDEVVFIAKDDASNDGFKALPFYRYEEVRDTPILNKEVLNIQF